MVNYRYDSTANGSYGVGRLASISTAAASNDYVYNALGLITKKFTQIDNTLSTTQYTYDATGNLASVTYPSGRIVSYDRDSIGRVQAVKTKFTATASEEVVLSALSYLPFGPASSYSYGNGLTHTNSFDTDYRLTAIQVGGILSRGYGYDTTDNITAINDLVTTAKSQAFSYDALNRLINASGSYGALGYTCDAVGILTSPVPKYIPE